MNYAQSIAGVALILGVLGLVYFQTKGTDIPLPSIAENKLENTETGGNTLSIEGISAADVRMHADKSSCWTIIDGAIYDLTSWVPKHPGGEQAILRLCGVDGSERYNGQHGGAQMQLKILTGFKIGVLVQ